jgi:hypothetical protein
MKQRTSLRIGPALGLAALLVTAASPALPGPGNSSPGIAPPNSKAFGKSLGEWLEIYWTWSYGFGPASGTVGKVMLLPMPSTSKQAGTGTVADPQIFVGHADLTLPPGTPFVLPVCAWLGEAYQDGSMDPALPADWLGRYYGAEVTLDGKPILTNLKDYYVAPTKFEPPLLYSEPTDYGSIGIGFFQSAGFVSTPLNTGVHHMTVRAWFLVPADNGMIPESGFIFENSWTITVAR